MRTLRNPTRCDIAVTGKCNLSCRYCYYADKMNQLGDLALEDWIGFFDQLSSLGVMRVDLTGGEIFTRPDLFEMIDSIIQRRMRYSLCTNGTLIDESVIAKFKTGRRRQRLESIQLSVDGSTAEIHNLSRPDSFDRVIPALKLLVREGFPVTVRVTVNRHNLHDLENTAALLLDEIGLQSFTTGEAFPMGAACGNRSEVVLTPQEQFQAMKILAPLAEKYNGRIYAMAGPQAKRRMYAEMEQAMATGVKTTRWGMGYLSGCGCVSHKLDVMHNGDIVPCHLLYEHVLGNVLTDSFGDIWRNHEVVSRLRSRHEIPTSAIPGCEDCMWAPYCNASCPGVAGNFVGASMFDCYRYFINANGGQAREYFQKLGAEYAL